MEVYYIDAMKWLPRSLICGPVRTRGGGGTEVAHFRWPNWLAHTDQNFTYLCLNVMGKMSGFHENEERKKTGQIYQARVWKAIQLHTPFMNPFSHAIFQFWWPSFSNQYIALRSHSQFQAIGMFNQSKAQYFQFQRPCLLWLAHRSDAPPPLWPPKQK